MIVSRKIKSFFNPEHFQGWGRQRNYFEGWYFKVVSADGSRAFAFIPGIAMDADGHAHAFVQVLDGKRKTAAYHRFDADDFRPAADRFYVEVAGSSFSQESIQLDLEGLSGNLHFTGNVPWPKPFYAPGIMGPFSFVPYMECYHGIVSMDHAISGMLYHGGEAIDMDGGRGYIEKDWGRSFPSAYMWMQCNHFQESGISLKASVARIPWLGRGFTGFISGLWLGDRLIRFTTYNGTVLRKCRADTGKVELVLENPWYTMQIAVDRDGTTALASPIMGMMDGRIEESMTSAMRVQLTHRQSRKIVFEGQGNHAAVEVAGEVDRIMTKLSV
ncbi:MAG: hypothetical protein RLY85_1776 [Bacteroidota bacterium]|jgi:hypothetical protein